MGNTPTQTQPAQAALKGKLSAQAVARASTRGLFGDGGGLYLQVSKSGSKSWLFRYRVGGRLRHHGLGSAQTVSLAEARAAALACRKLRLSGGDPIAAAAEKRRSAQQAAAQAVTFSEAAAQCIAANRAGWRNPKHAAQWTATLSRYAFPVFGDWPVAAVDAPAVLRAVAPIWASKNETASRLRGRIEAVLDWAKVHGLRHGENPARWRGNLSHTLPPRSRVAQTKQHAALPHAALPDLWQQLAARGSSAALALQFLILTAARTGEVIGARWQEIDRDNRLWVVPAGRMKSGRVHRVPLAPPALAVLDAAARQRQSQWVFAGGKPDTGLSNAALAALLKKMGHTGVTVHGFRSTFRDWVADKTDAAPQLAEAALAHAKGDAVEAAYFRSDLLDKRRQLMAAWAAFATGKTDCALAQSDSKC